MTEQEMISALVDSGTDVTWLMQMIEEVRTDTSMIHRPFSAAARMVGRDLIPGVDWRRDDLVRVLMLRIMNDHAWTVIDDLYVHGDAAEQRAVLLSLRYLPSSDAGMSLVRDALRTNQPVLVRSALNSYSLDRLSEEELNQAVVKCVFLEIPLATIDGLERRANPTLSVMLADLACERVAAGRDISEDVWPLISSFPPESQIESLVAELHSDVAERRQSARMALQAWRKTKGET